jgi:hypothetical protein
VGRLILPAANLAISKTRELFSGEPSMTLKVITKFSLHNTLKNLCNLIKQAFKEPSISWSQVIPFLLLGAEYGHLVTLRRLCGIGMSTIIINCLRNLLEINVLLIIYSLYLGRVFVNLGRVFH